jgi:hypothetical protein
MADSNENDVFLRRDAASQADAKDGRGDTIKIAAIDMQTDFLQMNRK